MLVGAWRSRGIGFYELTRYIEAIKCFDAAIKTYENVQALDKNDTTTTATTKAIEDISFDDTMYYCIADIWYEKGLSYSNLEDYEQAKECFDKAIEIDPNFADAWHNKGISLGNLEEYQEAIKCFDMVIDKYPNDADAWRNKGFVLSKLRGDIDKEVIECFDKAIEIKPYFAYAWNSKGYAFLKFKEKNGSSGEYDTKGILDKAIEGEKYEQAIQCFNEAIKTDPNFVHAWYNKGYALICQKKYEDALECIDKATNIDSKNPYAWNYKGYAHLGLKRYDEAIRDFDKAIEIDSKGNIEVWNYKGISILCSPQKNDEAIECFDRVINIDEKNAHAWNNKGYALNSLQRYKEAIECFDRAINIDKGFADAWHNKGVSLGNSGNYEKSDNYRESIECFDTAINILENSRNGKRIDLDIDQDLADCTA